MTTLERLTEKEARLNNAYYMAAQRAHAGCEKSARDEEILFDEILSIHPGAVSNSIDPTNGRDE